MAHYSGFNPLCVFHVGSRSARAMGSVAGRNYNAVHYGEIGLSKRCAGV